MKQKLL